MNIINSNALHISKYLEDFGFIHYKEMLKFKVMCMLVTFIWSLPIVNMNQNITLYLIQIYKYYEPFKKIEPDLVGIDL
jgi:uncharacterized protein YggT (Ycf19 family)